MPEEEVNKPDDTKDTEGEKTDTKVQIPEQVEAAVIKANVGGREVQMDQTELDTVLTRAQGMYGLINQLIKEGVIDEEGNTIQKKDEPTVEVDDDLTPEQKEIAELKAQINEIKGETEKEKQTRQTRDFQEKVKAEIASARTAHEITQKKDMAHNIVEAVVLANSYMNPNVPVKDTYDKMAKALNGLIEEAKQDYIKRKTDGPTLDTDGGGSIIAADKKFTAEDLRKGNVGAALADKLKEMF
jgi:transposase-like protein